MVEWDNSGNYLEMTATDNNTFKVTHGNTTCYFKRGMANASGINTYLTRDVWTCERQLEPRLLFEYIIG